MYSFLQRMNATMAQAEKSNSESANLRMTNWMKDLQNTKVERSEMNKLVMDYLITEGFKDAAEKFKMEACIEPSQSFDILDERIRIREAVQNGCIDEAVDLTNSLNPDILDCSSYLFFHLQQQKLIELIREKKVEKAIQFAQDVLSELGSEKNELLEELEKSMALLAFEDPETSPFGDLLKLSQRHRVASELNAAILESQHQETLPKLAGIMKLVLWSQNELDKKHARYPKMVDIATGKIKNSSDNKITTITIT